MTAPVKPQDRIQIYPKNRHYFQYKGKPIMLVGINQGWVRSLQDLDFDFIREFNDLQKAGGNVVRIGSHFTPQPGKAANANLPWARTDNGKYLLDLESSGGNPAYWNRLADLAQQALDRDIIVVFEFWDLYGPGRMSYWPGHPFCPGNNVELESNEQLDSKTHIRDIALTRPITRGRTHRPKALGFLEQFVRKCLDTLSPFPNILHLITNETSGEKAWSDYWVNFTHDYYRQKGNLPHVVGEMPREYKFVENFSVEDMVLDGAYDFADASQNFGEGTAIHRQKLITEIQHCIHWADRYRGIMIGAPERTKPITAAKIYSNCAPTPLWARMMCGAAISRYHRVWMPPIENPEEIQLKYVSLLTKFLKNYEIHPWNMEPTPGRTLHPRNIDGMMVLTDFSRPRFLLYILSMVKETPKQFSFYTINTGKYELLWYSATTGQTITQRIRVELDTDGGAADYRITLPEDDHFQQTALLMTKIS